MNPSVCIWNNPLPPGTEATHEEDELSSTSSKSKPFEGSRYKSKEHERYDSDFNSQYRRHSRSHSRSKRRKSRDRRHRSRDTHRSRSRDHLRHRSRSYDRHHRRSSSGRHKSKKESRQSRKYLRSTSRSHSRSRSRSHHSKHQTKIDVKNVVNSSIEEEEDQTCNENTFKNDGSFLEMFKKMQEDQQKAVEEAAKEQQATNVLPSISKRRGGKILKTGMVEKSKPAGESGFEQGFDAWSVYMNEVRRYKEACCDDDSKTRPLVKMSSSDQDSLQALMKTAPYDARFPNTNQTRYCFVSFVDYQRCKKMRGEDYEACGYFYRVFNSVCPNAWIEKWDTQLQEGTFPADI